MENLGLMKMVHEAARHAAARQSHIARNIANADTPDYRANDITSFADSLQNESTALRTTRVTHLTPTGPDASLYESVERMTEAAPNGNNVSLEHEMMESIVAQTQHSTAISIYSSARDILKASLGR